MYRSLESAKPERLTVASNVSNRVLCLPIFDSLTPDEFASIIATMQRVLDEHR
jgi:dTDP-4-amino-4,6-dideoxygalactose transaminase